MPQQPKIMLATLCLNEIEWLPKLYEQHKDWPGLDSWVFVEAVDMAYARANPKFITERFLSVDGTTEFLTELCGKDSRCHHIPFGMSRHADIAQGKVPARQQYIERAALSKPDWIVILDADEFYPKSSQQQLTEMLSHRWVGAYTGVCLRQREIWRCPSQLDDPLFKWEVVGGLWKMHHCHLWKYVEGMRYDKSHVWPQFPSGQLMNAGMFRADIQPGSPQWCHLGWAARRNYRIAKTRYYRARGEGAGDGRQKWMICRDAWETYIHKPGHHLPHGAQVIPYDGAIPECFQSECLR